MLPSARPPPPPPPPPIQIEGVDASGATIARTEISLDATVGDLERQLIASEISLDATVEERQSALLMRAQVASNKFKVELSYGETALNDPSTILRSVGLPLQTPPPARVLVALSKIPMCLMEQHPLNLHEVHAHALSVADPQRTYPQYGGVWTCDLCSHQRRPGDPEFDQMWHCGRCEFDCCGACANQQIARFVGHSITRLDFSGAPSWSGTRTGVGHPHALSLADPARVHAGHGGRWICDACDRPSEGPMYRSAAEPPRDYDVCRPCLDAQDTAQSPVHGHRLVLYTDPAIRYPQHNGRWICDGCEQLQPRATADSIPWLWACEKACDFSLCNRCCVSSLCTETFAVGQLVESTAINSLAPMDVSVQREGTHAEREPHMDGLQRWNSSNSEPMSAPWSGGRIPPGWWRQGVAVITAVRQHPHRTHWRTRSLVYDMIGPGGRVATNVPDYLVRGVPPDDSNWWTQGAGGSGAAGRLHGAAQMARDAYTAHHGPITL